MIKEIYAKSEDITFIMVESEQRLPNGMMELRQSLVGWYYGFPNEANTRAFMGKFEAVCEYELEDEE
ncbi:hypothetical protein SAMN02745671_01142 [Anaerovibrio lipolyticus DSM 3074]|uniref:Uncharacterized protein n=1 Tax=Anaerovibrio lipolyticus DSM 3074 TaxID=1120997 RepID=A0A1M6CKC0_9FIRM|nr:hypothetical protein [Anaerovibrio lipolyticus]SHI61158.1 hypothetical protein SAMN02745671_01142 [Anaerovibrio lipolyticus DSM 3074]